MHGLTIESNDPKFVCEVIRFIRNFEKDDSKKYSLYMQSGESRSIMYHCDSVPDWMARDDVE